MSLEASRLARNGPDWHTLLEFCGRVGTLIVDSSISLMNSVQPLGQKRCLGADVQHLAADADNEYAMIDSTIVRAHQHSAGAEKSW